MMMVVVTLAAVPAMAQQADTTKRPVMMLVQFAGYKPTMKPVAADLVNHLDMPLRVSDKAGLVYSVVSYRLGWRRREVNDDARTGRRKTVFVYYATPVKNSDKIPADWQKEIKENLQISEELSFEEIIVKHPKNGKLYMAQNLVLKML